MTLSDLTARLVSLLDEFNVPYMIVGSIASSYHGEPRMTRDVDVVIDPPPDSLGGLVRSLASTGFYVDADAAAEALAHRTQFNVIDPSTGWKVDLLIRKDRPFSREEFARKQEVELPTGSAFLATAEDTIIANLEWAREGESERQLRDAASILAVSGDRLDFAYLERWVDELGLKELWASIRENEP